MNRFALIAAGCITALCAACSSTSGTPVQHVDTSFAAGHASTSSAPARAGSSSPHAADSPATTAAAGSNSDAEGWCHQLKSAGVAELNSGTASPDEQATAQRLIATAPAQIRADLETLWHDQSSGNLESPGTMQAAETLAHWLQSNCPDVFADMNPTSMPTG